MNSNLKYIGEDLDTKSIRYLVFDRSMYKQVEQYCAVNKIKLRKHRIIIEESYNFSVPTSVNTNVHKSQRATNGYFFENEEEESFVQLKFDGQYKQDVSFSINQSRNQDYERSTKKSSSSDSDAK